MRLTLEGIVIMMSKTPHSANWDEKFKQQEYLYGTQPSQFIVAQQNWLKSGQKALSIADGEGRNSVFMSEKGVQVTAMDSSSIGIAKAQKLAGSRSVEVNFQHADLLEWQWEVNTYDLVAAIFIQFAGPDFRAKIFAGMIKTLVPGGILLLHGYTPRQLEYGTGGPSKASLLYTKEMLSEVFKTMEIIRLEEYNRKIQEGAGHSGMSALIDLIARKPLV